MSKIENEEKKPFPPEALVRLKTVDVAVTAMTQEERSVAFEWLRVKFRRDWPSNY